MLESQTSELEETVSSAGTDQPVSTLTADETELFDLIQAGKFDFAKRVLLNSKDVRVSCVDCYGTSLLQQAAFKGATELCQLLLDLGAPVNETHHNQGYTALMFGGLSGSPDVVRLLLDAGADAEVKNKIGRTAGDLASFTGQTAVVAVLNNFLSPDDILCYTKPLKGEKEALLPGALAPHLQELVRLSNIHPVNIIWFLIDHPTLGLKQSKAILLVLGDIVERQMKAKETNEVMAFKIHILHRTLNAFYAFSADACKKNPELPEQDSLTAYAKHLLSAKEQRYPKNLENFLRQTIKEFPYHQSLVMTQTVRTLAKTAVGSEPSAWTLIHQILLGQRLLADETFCSACGSPFAAKRCSACKTVNYCTARCQKLAWKAGHSKWCATIADETKKSNYGLF